MSPTYCTRADIEALWRPSAVLESVDDDFSGALSTQEESYIDRAIERAAGDMNALLSLRYDLADLVGNAWCRNCNAALAAYLLATRQGETAPVGIFSERERYFTALADIRDSRQNIPGVVNSVTSQPGVSNFAIDLRERRAKVRRVVETSTGGPPSGHLLDFPATD